MKRIGSLLLTWLVLALAAGCGAEPPAAPAAPRPRVLVFCKTAGFRHASLADGVAAVQELGQAHGFGVDTTERADRFSAEGLRPYAAVVFLNTTGDVLAPAQQAAFERFIAGGKGFAGVHAATDTEYDWPWYGGLVGAYFDGHPAVQPATVRVLDRAHPATAALPAAWARRDEWYNFRALQPGLSVLATLDESTYAGGTHGAFHPIAWCHAYGGGRAFYTAGGHTPESYQEPLFRQHLLGGLRYAMGLP